MGRETDLQAEETPVADIPAAAEEERPDVMNGSDIMTGGSIIIPIAMSALATIISITIKGIKR